jgi:hypothetical protein
MIRVQSLIGPGSPHIRKVCFLMYHPSKGFHKSSPPWTLSQSHKALCNNVRGHSLSVGRLVLQATVKAAVSMGDLTAHHYGSLSHPVSCQCTYTNPYFNSGSHHHPLQQAGCVLPWCTEPCVTAKRPLGEFLKVTT